MFHLLQIVEIYINLLFFSLFSHFLSFGILWDSLLTELKTKKAALVWKPSLNIMKENEYFFALCGQNLFYYCFIYFLLGKNAATNNALKDQCCYSIVGTQKLLRMFCFLHYFITFVKFMSLFFYFQNLYSFAIY